jgi:nucleoside-diphosphate-sugar epimerase
MRVAVTGSSGKLGIAAVAALRAAGHHVIGLDTKPAPDGSRSVIVDCADLGQVLDALSGVDIHGGPPDAVVHLAALRAPGLAPDGVVFRVNTLSTYNVFTACAKLGINRVAWASSETLLGLPFTTPPDFLPLDETHPDRPEWHYSLAKLMGETLADQFVRWHPELSIVSLRFSNVLDDADYESLRAVHAHPDQRKFNVWAYVDARDAGEACRLAVEADLTGHHRLIIAAADSFVDTPSDELAATFYPDVPVTRELTGFETLLSPARAAEVIGYHPAVSWRDK